MHRVLSLLLELDSILLPEDSMAGAEIIVFPLGIMNAWCYLAIIFHHIQGNRKQIKVSVRSIEMISSFFVLCYLSCMGVIGLFFASFCIFLYGTIRRHLGIILDNLNSSSIPLWYNQDHLGNILHNLNSSSI
jgi:hypothetical protein